MEKKQLYLFLTLIYTFITGVPSTLVNHDKSKDMTYPSIPPHHMVSYPVYPPPFPAYIYYPAPYTYPAMLHPHPGYIPVARQPDSQSPPSRTPVTIVEDDTHTSLLEYPTKESNNPMAWLLSEFIKSQLKTQSYPTTKRLDGRPVIMVEKERLNENSTRRVAVPEIPPCPPQHCTVAETLLFYTNPITYCASDIIRQLVSYPLQELDSREQMVIGRLVQICEENNMKPIIPYAGGPSNGKQIYEDILTKTIECIPRERAVEFQVNGDVIYKPQCYNVTICAGCGMDDIHECLPTKTRSVTKKVYVFKQKPPGALPGNELDYLEIKEIQVEEHVECKIQCKVKKCGRHQTYDPQKCECGCRKRNNCEPGKSWNEQKCRCECSVKHPCSTGRKFSNASCSCERRT